MSGHLLDASALIYWLKGRPPAVELLSHLLTGTTPTAINAVTVAETYSGVADADAEAIHRLVAQFEFWQISYTVARLAGQYRYRYARLGRPLSVTDTLMAAHAITRDATLVTSNIRDFPMPELKLQHLPTH